MIMSLLCFPRDNVINGKSLHVFIIVRDILAANRVHQFISECWKLCAVLIFTRNIVLCSIKHQACSSNLYGDYFNRGFTLLLW